MSDLVGLAIEVKGKERFVGKVGVYAGPQGRQRILYREANFGDFFSCKSNSFGIDKRAADYASKVLKAETMICFCKDTRDQYEVPTKRFESAEVSDLGELSQYRIPIEDFRVSPDRDPIKMGYTKNVIKIR